MKTSPDMLFFPTRLQTSVTAKTHIPLLPEMANSALSAHTRQLLFWYLDEHAPVNRHRYSYEMCDVLLTHTILGLQQENWVLSTMCCGISHTGSGSTSARLSIQPRLHQRGVHTLGHKNQSAYVLPIFLHISIQLYTKCYTYVFVYSIAFTLYTIDLVSEEQCG